MADIKDFKRNQFLVKKEEKEPIKESGSLNSRIARYRIVTFYKICAVLGVIATIALYAYFDWKNTVYTDYVVQQEYAWKRSTEAHSLNLNGTLFTYSKDGMSCTDNHGKVIWNQTYEMQNPMVRTCQNVVAVGDYNGRTIYVSNSEEIMGSIDTTMPIRDFCVAENGVVAVVLDDSKVTVISLYSVSGEELVDFRTTMSKSGYPVALDISDDGGQVAVSYLKAEGGEMSTSVGFYNFLSVGQNYTDNLVAGYGYADAIVPVVEFMNHESAFAVADNRLMFYQGRQKPENIANIMINNQIQSVYYNEKYVGLVFRNMTGESTYSLDIYDALGNKEKTIHFNQEYSEIVFCEEAILIYNEDECSIYDWEGKVKYEGVFKERIECILPLGNIERYILVTNDSIQMIKLQ
ncbi:MAG: hypothetical protein IJN64_16760 [Lachnospiraceae bacterium]|nr:hypothetical protein [Lachnospiraceae bacterium]